jgi:hypothetical protein
MEVDTTQDVDPLQSMSLWPPAGSSAHRKTSRPAQAPQVARRESRPVPRRQSTFDDQPEAWDNVKGKLAEDSQGAGTAADTPRALQDDHDFRPVGKDSDGIEDWNPKPPPSDDAGSPIAASRRISAFREPNSTSGSTARPMEPRSKFPRAIATDVMPAAATSESSAGAGVRHSLHEDDAENPDGNTVLHAHSEANVPFASPIGPASAELPAPSGADLGAMNGRSARVAPRIVPRRNSPALFQPPDDFSPSRESPLPNWPNSDASPMSPEPAGRNGRSDPAIVPPPR